MSKKGSVVISLMSIFVMQLFGSVAQRRTIMQCIEQVEQGKCARICLEKPITCYEPPLLFLTGQYCCAEKEAVLARDGLSADALVRRLLEAGANPNIVGIMGLTPLMCAVTYATESVISMLLMHGADVNAMPCGSVGKQEVPLLIQFIHAIDYPMVKRSTEEYIRIGKLLHNYGADPLLLDMYGKNACDYLTVKLIAAYTGTRKFSKEKVFVYEYMYNMFKKDHTAMFTQLYNQSFSRLCSWYNTLSFQTLHAYIKIK